MAVLHCHIPLHHNTFAKPDRFGDPAFVFISPMVASLVYLLITWLKRYPEMFNYMVKITEDNARLHYTLATRMLRMIKLGVLFIFTLITFFQGQAVWSDRFELGAWFLPVAFSIAMVPVVCYFVSLTRENQDRSAQP